MNKVILSGEIVEKPIFSHEIYDRKFYEFAISSIRTSGTRDVIRCIIREGLVDEIKSNERLELHGEIRTRNADGKLKVYMFVTSIGEYKTDRNEVYMNGFTCKKLFCRKTLSGRFICDILVAHNRENSRKSDYIPCIAWGINAVNMDGCTCGVSLDICGRFQSREYLKKYEDGSSEIKTAYEVSISKILM